MLADARREPFYEREFAKLSVHVVIEVIGTPRGLFTWVPLGNLEPPH